MCQRNQYRSTCQRNQYRAPVVTPTPAPAPVVYKPPVIPTRTITLEIISAKGLPGNKSNKSPSSFVQITVGGFKAKTATIQNDDGPTWNEEFNVPSVQNDTMLTLAVEHERMLFGSYRLSTGTVSVGQLFKQIEAEKQATISMKAADGVSDGGVLRLRVKEYSPALDVEKKR